MIITAEQLEQFWKKHMVYANIPNKKRLYQDFLKEIEKNGTTENLEDYVYHLRNGKESTRKVIVDFFEFLGFETDLKEKRFYDQIIERQLEIAKFLHQPKTFSEIQDHFSIEKRTLQLDLKALEDGIEVLGSRIQIQQDKIDKSTTFYHSTLHPIFLPLNLTEVYAMTAYLEHMMPLDEPNAHIIQNICNRIKTQLTDYAYEKLYHTKERPKWENNYIDDASLARQREGILMYLLKSGNTCQFFYKGNQYHGKISLGKDYQILLDDGTMLPVDIDEVEFIIDSISYE